MCGHGCSPALKEGERTKCVVMVAVLFGRKVRDTDFYASYGVY